MIHTWLIQKMTKTKWKNNTEYVGDTETNSKMIHLNKSICVITLNFNRLKIINRKIKQKHRIEKINLNIYYLQRLIQLINQ